MTHDELLAYYLTPGPFTDLGPYAEQVGAIPADVAAIVPQGGGMGGMDF